MIPQPPLRPDSAGRVPLTLGIECSGTLCSVALTGVHGQPTGYSAERLQPGEQLTFLFPMALELLQQHGIAPRQLERIGVSVGPGSFTGLRLAITTVRTMALVLGCPVVGVPTLEATALRMLDALDAAADEACTGRLHEVIVMSDARKGQVFAASWAPASSPLGWRLTAAAPAMALEPHAAADFLRERASAGSCLVGGSGLEAYPAIASAVEQLRHTGSLRPAAASTAVPHAVQVAQVAAGRHGEAALLDQASLEPFYLRPPDVTPPRARKRPGTLPVGEP